MSLTEFKKLVKQIKDKKFRVKVEKFVEISFKKFKKMGELDFFSAPAGKSHHHSYRGGLVQHTFSTVRIALALAEVLEKVYGWKKVNKDYVLAGALLHDLYKPLTYRVLEDGIYDFSTIGDKLDHLSLLVGEAYKHKFPVDFIHVLAASHGDSSPVYPKTVEALIVHLADFVDSRMMGEIQRAASYLIRKCTGESEHPLPPQKAFQIVYAKQVGGCEKVKEVLKIWKKD